MYGAGGGLKDHERKGEPTSPSLSINAKGTQISQFVCCMNNTVSRTTMVYSSCQNVPTQAFLFDRWESPAVLAGLTNECGLQCNKVVYGAGGGLKDHERKGEPTSPPLSINAKGTQISQFVCCMKNTVSRTTMVYSSCQNVPTQAFLFDRWESPGIRQPFPPFDN